jgi:hypothetical protein
VRRGGQETKPQITQINAEKGETRTTLDELTYGLNGSANKYQE